MIPTNSALAREVTDAERDSFSQDGVVHLRGIYPLEWVHFLERQLVEVFDGQPARAMDQREISGDSNTGVRVDMAAMAVGLRSRMPDVPIALDGGVASEVLGRSIVETDAAHWHEGLRQHHMVGPLPELVAQLTETDKVNFYSDQLFLKEPGSRIRTPFHQDQPYFLVDGQVAVCWVPVDHVGTENGPMGYVPGSHRWNKLFKPSDFITDTGTFPEVNGVDHSDLELMPRISEDEYDIVYFEAEPGDVIVHHWSTVHGAAGNISASAIRRAASIRYAHGDSRYLQRSSSPEPFRFTTGLNDGDLLERADRFPVVWPREVVT
jgi:ectoine hydroxylase-related dioxygenase (phytanoyl-CoA dioxygenase family)